MRRLAVALSRRLHHRRVVSILRRDQGITITSMQSGSGLLPCYKTRGKRIFQSEAGNALEIAKLAHFKESKPLPGGMICLYQFYAGHSQQLRASSSHDRCGVCGQGDCSI